MFSTEYKVKFNDCDPAGIMFYAKIYNLFHYAYEEMVRNFELEDNIFELKKYLVPIVHSSADYLKPLVHGNTFNISVKVFELGNSSFTLEYTIINSDSRICVKGKTVHVFLDQLGSKIDIPADFKMKLSEMFE